MAVHASHILGSKTTRQPRLGLSDQPRDAASLQKEGYSPRKFCAPATLSPGLPLEFLCTCGPLYLIAFPPGIHSAEEFRSLLNVVPSKQLPLTTPYTVESPSSPPRMLFFFKALSTWCIVHSLACCQSTWDYRIVGVQKSGSLFTTVPLAPNVCHVVKTNICQMNEWIFSVYLESLLVSLLTSAWHLLSSQEVYDNCAGDTQTLRLTVDSAFSMRSRVNSTQPQRKGLDIPWVWWTKINTELTIPRLWFSR